MLGQMLLIAGIALNNNILTNAMPPNIFKFINIKFEKDDKIYKAWPYNIPHHTYEQSSNVLHQTTSILRHRQSTRLMSPLSAMQPPFHHPLFSKLKYSQTTLLHGRGQVEQRGSAHWPRVYGLRRSTTGLHRCTTTKTPLWLFTLRGASPRAACGSSTVSHVPPLRTYVRGPVLCPLAGSATTL